MSDMTKNTPEVEESIKKAVSHYEQLLRSQVERENVMEQDEREYTICSVSGRPDWETVPRLAVDRVLWEPDCGIRASGQFCHDGENLYVHLRAAEKEIRAEYTAPLSPVCRDSCLEFFFIDRKSVV